MAKSQSTETVSDPTLAKLLDVETNLSTQAAEIAAKLEAIQEKRRSLKAVIDIFTHSDSSMPDIKTTPEFTPDITPATSSPEPSPTTAPATSEDTTDKKPRKSPSTTKSTQKGKSTKTSAKGQRWQQYVRDDFRKLSLPQAVSAVLERSPQRVFSTAEVVHTVFEDDMPKEAENQAKNRVSNILSTGLNDNRWFRGKPGHYSVSQKTAKADLGS